ncbi:hypothetical protein [Kitasatospora sp. GAS1066B]|uniref:hypothetical protein n=1 Tax=Kitasatospora sp. GAS1066B TaxID=3156271 RepID=UPI003514D725
MLTAVPAPSQQRPDQRLLAAATTIAGLQSAVPAAYREQGPPALTELAEQTTAISAQHQLLLTTAAALARSPRTGAHRAAVRPLADAAEKLGRAVATISRAASMAGQLYEVDGLASPAAQQNREKAGQQLNLALSHTRLALGEAVDNLRTDALALSMPPSGSPANARGPRSSAAVAAGNRTLVAISAAALRAELPAAAPTAQRSR